LNPATILLVNDLDLRILRESTTYSPWILDRDNPQVAATTGDNIRDNVEQVHVSSPAAGRFTIRITQKGTLAGGSQAVSLIVSGQSQPITVNTRIFLEGPYSADSMRAVLGSRIPLTQSYTSTPWSYGGTETVTGVSTGVVDWVLLEIRTDTAAATKAGTRAAFVRTDGTIVDLDGTSPVAFGAAAGDYYIVIHHRNHISVMSASAVPLTAASPLYDFTTGLSRYFGGEAISLGGGVYGIAAGDVDGNTGVGASDLVNTRVAIGSVEYIPEDVDMNGGVGASDLVKVRLNIGQASRVP
jgi:hypothetical protein